MFGQTIGRKAGLDAIESSSSSSSAMDVQSLSPYLVRSLLLQRGDYKKGVC